METNSTETPKNKSNRWLILLLLLSIGFNIGQWMRGKEKHTEYITRVDSLVSDNSAISLELEETTQELNQYKGINARLDSLLTEANGQVDAQKQKINDLIRRMKNGEKVNKELNAELAELRNLKDQYLEKIDALLVENEQLKKEKAELSSTVETLSKNLESTVNTASILKAEYFKVTPFKKRSNDKYTETMIAKRTNRLQTCFSVLENKIAKAGSKTVYLRVVEPGGKVLGNRSEGSSSFRVPGTSEDLMYTASQTIDYGGEKQDLCINWDEADRIFTPGTYLLEVFVDGYPSGSSSVTLR